MIIRTVIILLFFILTRQSAQAQYLGGEGSGHDRSSSLQLNLQGQPFGTQPLYAGGPGDGQDTQTGIQQALNGQSLTVLFIGGRSDGHARALAHAPVAGGNLSQMYLGGMGDGHDEELIQTSLSGQYMDVLYGGGQGDGFDGESAQLFISGASLAVLYGGGQGDGHDLGLVQSVVGGGSLTALYGGGGGDGYDVASYGGAVPFPVVLLSFEAFPMDTFVLLEWRTEREENSHWFVIDRSVDGLAFESIGQVPAAGSSESMMEYNFEDGRPLMGKSFYRLKMIDLDGAFSYSHLVEVQYSQLNNWSFNLFPNPNSGNLINIDLRGLTKEEEFTVEVLDMAGKSLYQTTLRPAFAGGLTHTINLERQLTQGSYLVRVRNPAKEQQSKILLIR